MAIFHLDVTNVHAGKAARASDYRAREGREAGLGHHEAGGLVGWTGDRQALWDEAEKAEKPQRSRINEADRKRTRVVARSIILALPHELEAEDRARLARGFSMWLRDRHGVAVQWDNHTPESSSDPRQFHAHLLLTSRAVDSSQKFGGKTRELDQKTPASTHIQSWRNEWEKRCNRELERAGVSSRVDGRSHEQKAQDEGRLVSKPPRPRVPPSTWKKAKSRASSLSNLKPVFSKADRGAENLENYVVSRGAFDQAAADLKALSIANLEAENAALALDRIRVEAERFTRTTREIAERLAAEDRAKKSQNMRRPPNQQQKSR